VRHQVADVADGDRIDAGQRLVEQDEVGLRGQRAGDLDAPPLAAGQRNGRGAPQMGDGELAQQLVEPRSRSWRLGSTTSSTARMFCSTDRPRKIEASCGR
jgi:hypothetical protein